MQRARVMINGSFFEGLPAVDLADQSFALLHDYIKPSEFDSLKEKLVSAFSGLADFSVFENSSRLEKPSCFSFHTKAVSLIKSNRGSGISLVFNPDANSFASFEFVEVALIFPISSICRTVSPVLSVCWSTETNQFSVDVHVAHEANIQINNF